MAAKSRIGVIGRTGKGNYGHGVETVWADLPRTEVVAVADENEQGRAEAANRTKAARTYADYREMLDKEQLDIVAVCPRWIDQHHAMVMAAVEQGCHVFMEKPFCRTLEQADDIVRALEMRHLRLGIAHQTRYHPVLPVVRDLIKAGEIGEVLEIRARGKEDSRGGGEDLWVLGTHMMDLMQVFAGNVAWCFGTVTVKGQPITKADVDEGNEGIGPLAGDAVEARYRFANGINGYFASHRNVGGNPSRFGLQIFGSKGIIEFLSGYLTPVRLLRDPSWSPGRSGAKWLPISSNGIDKPETLSGDGLHTGNARAAEDLLQAIETNRDPDSNAATARAATEMIVAVFESQRLGGPVRFPLENRKNPLTML